MNLEQTIINNLVNNEEFNRKTLPFLKEEYFENQEDKILFSLINDYTLKYNALPSKESLKIDLENLTGISEDVCKSADLKIESFKKDSTNLEYLVTKTEEFCKEQAIFHALRESINILEDSKTKDGVGVIPKLLSDALAVSFDTNIGHDFLEDTELRYEFYHQRENRVSFDIDYLNKITKGGVPRKTLNCLMSSKTGGGKTLTMCHFAASYLLQGYNVLYISMEMAEYRIAERIDANLMGICLDDLITLPKDAFMKKAARVKEKAKGKLVIKEYPTGSVHSGHFRHLIQELKIKKNFTPDVIIIDYLNICSSARVKMSGSVNTYTYVKTIAEELRGLAVETGTVIWTATQGNRSAINSSDIDLENTSESIGLAATLDLFLAIITTEELEAMNHLMFKQLKNRYGPLDYHRRFVVGVDRSKMTLYNVEESVQGSYTAGEEQPKQQTNQFAVGKKKDFSKFQ